MQGTVPQQSYLVTCLSRLLIAFPDPSQTCRCRSSSEAPACLVRPLQRTCSAPQQLGLCFSVTWCDTSSCLAMRITLPPPGTLPAFCALLHGPAGAMRMRSPEPLIFLTPPSQPPCHPWLPDTPSPVTGQSLQISAFSVPPTVPPSLPRLSQSNPAPGPGQMPPPPGSLPCAVDVARPRPVPPGGTGSPPPQEPGMRAGRALAEWRPPGASV